MAFGAMGAVSYNAPAVWWFLAGFAAFVGLVVLVVVFFDRR